MEKKVSCSILKTIFVIFIIYNIDFFFVLCNDLILYGEEMIGMFTKNSKQRYKFHREYDLAAIYLVLISSDSKSFIIVGADKGK